jgi:hypothetical protein
MKRKPLPSTLYSEILPMTPEQEAKGDELEKLGWIPVTPPENIFNGAMMMEATDGITHFVHPDGTVE